MAKKRLKNKSLRMKCARAARTLNNHRGFMFICFRREGADVIWHVASSKNMKTSVVSVLNSVKRALAFGYRQEDLYFKHMSLLPATINELDAEQYSDDRPYLLVNNARMLRLMNIEQDVCREYGSVTGTNFARIVSRYFLKYYGRTITEAQFTAGSEMIKIWTSWLLDHGVLSLTITRAIWRTADLKQSAHDNMMPMRKILVKR